GQHRDPPLGGVYCLDGVGAAGHESVGVALDAVLHGQVSLDDASVGQVGSQHGLALTVESGAGENNIHHGALLGTKVLSTSFSLSRELRELNLLQLIAISQFALPYGRPQRLAHTGP